MEKAPLSDTSHIVASENKVKYTVNVREVWIQPHEVEANSPEEATLIVADGGGEVIEGDFEYSHMLDRSLWDVTDENGNLHNII